MSAWRQGLGFFLVGLQLVGIGYARLVDTRYFCWAPHNQITEYELQATVNGQPLSAEQLQARYRLSARGIDDRCHFNVLQIVELTERTYHPQDHTQARVNFRVNGGPEVSWQYRQP